MLPTGPAANLITTSFGLRHSQDSLLILFECMSLEGWIDVLRSQISITSANEQKDLGSSAYNAIFMMSYVLIGSGLILAVFLGLLIANYGRQSGSALLTEPQRKKKDLFRFLRHQKPGRRPPAYPAQRFRAWCSRRASQKRGVWARLFTALYVMHLLFLCLKDYHSTVISANSLDAIFLVLSGLFAIDIAVGLYGIGWKYYFKNRWNIYYVVVVAGLLSTGIPLFFVDVSGGPAISYIVQAQKVCSDLLILEKYSHLIRNDTNLDLYA